MPIFTEMMNVNGMNLSTTFQKKMNIDSFPFSFELENRERKTGTKGKRGRIYFLVGNIHNTSNNEKRTGT